MVETGASCFPSLAAEPSSAACRRPRCRQRIPTPKNRVWGFCGHPSGRNLSKRAQAVGTAPGCGRHRYKTASGRSIWPNRDPLGDFRFLQRYVWTGTRPFGAGGGKYYRLLTRYPFEFGSRGRNLYHFVGNQPVLFVDLYGLSDWKWTWWDLLTFYPHAFYDIGYGIQDGLCKIPETFNALMRLARLVTGEGKN